MRRLLVACVIGLSVITLVGWMKGDGRDRMGLSALNEPALLTIIVNLPDVDTRYHWLSVYGCTADVTESGAFCNGFWELESTRELFGYKQMLIPWRRVPKGAIRVTAMAFDGERKVLASNALTVFR